MRFRKTYVAIAMLLIVAVLAVRLAAQGGDNNGNPTILQAVHDLQDTINGFIASTAPGNTLTTPALVGFPPDAMGCTVNNVSDAQRTIGVQLINANTGAIVTGFQTVVKPNFAIGTFLSATAGGTRAFCKVTVSDGVKTDVRGVLAIFGGSSDRVAIAAE